MLRTGRWYISASGKWRKECIYTYNEWTKHQHGTRRSEKESELAIDGDGQAGCLCLLHCERNGNSEISSEFVHPHWVLYPLTTASFYDWLWATAVTIMHPWFYGHLWAKSIHGVWNNGVVHASFIGHAVYIIILNVLFSLKFRFDC